jgi:hypothetical protein
MLLSTLWSSIYFWSWCFKSVLFKKLIKRNIDITLIRLLIFCYCQRTFCVRWGNQFSQFFTVSNGVRQGGIMSPVLFNIYLDEPSCNLNRSYIACSMNGMIINHLIYADDTCIIATSPSALLELLDICSDFAVSNVMFFLMRKRQSVSVSNQFHSMVYFYLITALMMHL